MAASTAHTQLVNAVGKLANYKQLIAAPALTMEVMDSVPDQRTNALVHHLAYWGSIEAFQETLQRFPTLNLTLLNRKGETALAVAKHFQRQAFADYLVAKQAIANAAEAERPTFALALELYEAAKGQRWKEFHNLLAKEEKKTAVAALNVVPLTKHYNAVHYLAHWVNYLLFITFSMILILKLNKWLRRAI